MQGMVVRKADRSNHEVRLKESTDGAADRGRSLDQNNLRLKLAVLAVSAPRFLWACRVS